MESDYDWLSNWPLTFEKRNKALEKFQSLNPHLPKEPLQKFTKLSPNNLILAPSAD